MIAKLLQLKPKITPTQQKQDRYHIPESPYVGLRPYTAEDRRVFYGRDRCATFLINKIYSSPLTLFYGRSGMGKSSLLHAKAIPLMEDNATIVLLFDQWSISQPVEALREDLADCATAHGAIDAASGGPTIPELVRLLSYVSQKTVVLILDQFEELLVWHGDRLETVTEVIASMLSSNLDMHLVISMREEYLAALEPLRGFIPTLFHSTYRIEPLNTDGLYAAISQPLQYFNATCDQALFWQLIEDLKSTQNRDDESLIHNTENNSVELPILQLICFQLWEEVKHDNERHLDLALYQRLGGHTQILKRYVSSVVPKGPRNKRVTADLLRVLAPASGLKMSFSADDLAHLSDLGLKKDRIIKELKRLESSKIIKAKKFHSEERFELLHDAFINILLPWAIDIRSRTSRVKRYTLATLSIIFIALAAGTLVQKREVDFWQEYANSVESRLADTEGVKASSTDHIQQLQEILDSHGAAQNSSQLVKAIQHELSNYRKDITSFAEETSQQVEKTSNALGKPTLPPELRLIRIDNVLELSGKLPNSESLERLHNVFPGYRISTSNLNISKKVVSPAWLEKLIENLDILQQLAPSFSVDISNRQITVTGLAKNAHIRKTILDTLAKPMTGDWKVINRIRIPPRVLIERTGSQITLSGLVPDSNIVNQLILGFATNLPPNVNQLAVGEYILNPKPLSKIAKLSSTLALLEGDAHILMDENRIVVSGIALNSQRKRLALQSLKPVAGHTWSLSDKIKVIPNFRIAKTGGQINLAGAVPNLLTLLQTYLADDLFFPPQNTVNSLSIDTDLMHVAEMPHIFKSTYNINQLIEPSSLHYANKKLTINGIARTQDEKNEIVYKLSQPLPSNWSVENNIKTLPTLNLKLDAGALSVNGTVANIELAETLAYKVRKFFKQVHVMDIKVNPDVTDTVNSHDILNLLGDPLIRDAVNTLSLSAGQLTLRGTTTDFTNRSKIIHSIESQLNPAWNFNNQIVAKPDLTIISNREKTTVQGHLPDAEIHQTLTKNLAQIASAKPIQKHIPVEKSVIASEQLESAIALVPSLQHIIEPSELTLLNDQLLIRGTVLNNQVKNDLCTGAQRRLGANHHQLTCQLSVPTLIAFEHDSDQLTDKAKALLNSTYLNLLSRYDVVEIGGHTDDTGNAMRNQKLSQLRAKAVKTYLTAQGIKVRFLTARGYSNKYPLKCTTDAQGRTPANRRIEFYINGERPRANCKTN